MAKIIKAVFGMGEIAKVCPQWQYDYNTVLQFVGLDLPQNYEVDLSNSKTGQSVTVLGNADGCTIPAQLFIPGSSIFAWVFVAGNDFGFTRAQVEIPISPRAQHTGDPPTPEQQDALDEAIELLNAAAEDLAEAEQGIPTAINTALAEAKASGEFDGPPGEPGQDGADGVGVPTGGTTGQVLKKKSNTDYDTEWSDLDDLADGIVASKSGSPAVFSDGADGKPVVDLKVQIGPSETGYTGANIVRTGKNLCVVNAANIQKPSWYTGGWSGTSVASGNGITQQRAYSDSGAGGIYIPEVPAGTYVVSMEEDSNDTCYMGVYYTTDGTDQQDVLRAASSLTRSGTKLYRSFTLPANKGLAIRPTGASVAPKTFTHIQLEQGATPTDYETPVRTEYSFDWQSAAGTVYEGELDVTTGVLTEGADTYQLTPTEVKTLLGDNVIWADTGDVAVRYRADTKLYVDANGGGGGSSVEPYTSNPAALGTASPGSSDKYARGDHVHAKPTAADIGAVAVAQGVAHAGEFVVVGSDGNITTVTMAVWQGGSY